MILYFDTSALLKLYVDERDSDSVRKLYSQAGFVCTHLIAYVELLAGVAKGTSLGRLSAEQQVQLLAEIEAGWRQLEVVEIDELLARRAGHLALRHALRGFDAVHLAAAERVMAETPTTARFGFVGVDLRMRSAAQLLGMEVLPASGAVSG
ncbi:MAG: type II toxin-antitoxin system VapC family toxin [Parvularculaceae bacterium]|nr:type II toxin-antitoxin system VapC family toxin [Parvularculaceae bacterium]